MSTGFAANGYAEHSPGGPARSTGPAVFVGAWALKQLWLFWAALLAGALLAGLTYRVLGGKEQT
ncbi:MAG: hypothetical protein ACREV4_12120 [Gammaproteobacteria bacterium]